MEDSEIKCSITHCIVPENYRVESVSLMTSTSNANNNQNYKYCFKISFKSNNDDEIKYFEEEVENMRLHLSDKYDIHFVSSAFAGAAYVISKEIIPCVKWNTELQAEVLGLIDNNGLDVDKFIFNKDFPTVRNAINAEFSDDEVLKLKKITNIISNKWSVRHKVTNKSLYIDIFLSISDE